MRTALSFAIASAFVLGGSRAHAQVVQTWGAPSAQPPSTAPAAAPSSIEVPPPPPPTIGVPVEGRPLASPPRSATAVADENEAIVRTKNMVGLRYALEGVEVRGNTITLARVVMRYVPFRAGDTLNVDDRELELTRFRLLGTGYFRDVRLFLRKGTRRGYVVLVVDVVERNTIIVNDIWLGLSADAAPNGSARPLTAYGGAHVSETNLAGTGVLLGGAFALADRQLGLRTRFADPLFLKTNWTAELELLYNRARDFFGNRDVLVDDPSQQRGQDFAVLSYSRFGGSVGAGHDLGTSTRLFLHYRLEKLDANLPFAASHHRGLDIEPIQFDIQRGGSVLSTLRSTLVYDTRDDPILPMQGGHWVFGAEASLTPLGSDYPYAKTQVRGSEWFRLPWGHVLRLEAFAGAIFGDAPLFEKFYVGDFTDLLPDRVLDLNFDRRPAPNFFTTSIAEVRYGQYASKLQGEYRIPIYRGQRSIYGVDFYGALGFYAVANERDVLEPPRGYTGLAKVPIDMTFNLGLRISTSVGGIQFGLSNVLGFLPVRGQESRVGQ